MSRLNSIIFSFCYIKLDVTVLNTDDTGILAQLHATVTCPAPGRTCITDCRALTAFTTEVIHTIVQLCLKLC